ncbi:MAG: hypothetical protein M1831_000304 [Alyxoria varia]|nr:MAG: hypothetical protein M1831_000304 [Alyxoria varia]
MAPKALVPFLVAGMLITGVANTLLTKYQDMQCVRNCSSKDLHKRHNFEQPVWQTAQMFVGEMGCWLVVGISALVSRLRNSSRFSSAAPNLRRSDYQPVPVSSETETAAIIDGTANEDGGSPHTATDQPRKPLVEDRNTRPLRGWRVILLALPAICDIAGTTLMNIGLLFVAASIYQMTRGALVLFVGLFSILFLRHHLSAPKWLALVIVVAGVAIVGLAGVIEQKDAKAPGVNEFSSSRLRMVARSTLGLLQRSAIAGTNDSAGASSTTSASTTAGPDTTPAQTIIGVLLIALAQIFTASQFVLEEAIMHRFTLTPLACVGWEGIFGLFTTLFAMLVLHITVGSTSAGKGGYFDAAAGWHDMISHRSVAVSSLLIMISIGGFNFFGLSVTRSVSATSRSTIDTCRTLFIWVVSLGLGWETFKWLQVLGFAGLVYGTFLFNDIVKPPRWRWWRRSTDGQQ